MLSTIPIPKPGLPAQVIITSFNFQIRSKYGVEQRHANKMDKKGAKYFIEEGMDELNRKRQSGLDKLEDIDLPVYRKHLVSRMDLEKMMIANIEQCSMYHIFML